MHAHVVLLGDSVFDNQAYTCGQPDVAGHLRALLPSPWRVTLGAVDGTTTEDIGPQLDRLRPGVSHVVVSLGGNDALLNADLLNLPVRSTAEALDRFRERLEDFEQRYRWVLAAGVGVIDLRAVCDRPADFANPIEPSGSGGLKIAEAVAVVLGERAPLAPAILLRGR